MHDKLVAATRTCSATSTAATPDAVAANWERIKQAEKGRGSVTEGIPAAMPALALAAKLQRKATGVGLEPSGDGAQLVRVAETVAHLAARVADGPAPGTGGPSPSPEDAGGASPREDGRRVRTRGMVGAALFGLADDRRRAWASIPRRRCAPVALALRDRDVARELAAERPSCRAAVP